MNSKDNIIRFRGYLTFPDSLKVQKAMEKRRWISPFAAISAVTLAATALAIYWMKVGMLFGGFLMVFMGAFMFGGLRLMRNAAAKTQKRVYEKACVKRTGALSPDGITIRKNKAVTTLPWDAFERAAALEGVVAVMKGTESLGFAKYMFDTETEWELARAMILGQYDRPGNPDPA
ncbi:hypothetical protein [Desulfococcus sp.]|uniref:hypothetical protein n=1 Tax=Desulfococcus sp. TaxID=2025834 RepID=UPI0035944DEF